MPNFSYFIMQNSNKFSSQVKQKLEKSISGSPKKATANRLSYCYNWIIHIIGFVFRRPLNQTIISLVRFRPAVLSQTYCLY